MFKLFRTATFAALLTVTTYAVALETEGARVDTYTVQKGDTLWSLAQRLFKQPWLWPEIWQANPQIKNPHLIYPGDRISLAYMNRVSNGTVKADPQQAIQPGPRQDAPIDAIPLVQVEPFLKDLYVVDSFEKLPYVVGLEEGRLRGTYGQAIYAVNLSGVQPSQRYAVMRPTVSYSLPKPTEDLMMDNQPIINSGMLWKEYVAPSKHKGFLGYELAQINIATVTQVGHDLQATTLSLQKGGREVRAGDRLIPVQAKSYDLQFFPHPPDAMLKEANLRVLAVADGFIDSGPRNVIAISGGINNGINNGTVFSIWRQGRHIKDRIGHRASDSHSDDRFNGTQGTVLQPDEYAAHAMVFRTFNNVSYALVMDATKPVKVGYTLKHPDAQ
ncbi:MAG TPA: LysM peptidoglycan-binding domain-containing protein [Xylella sp.]